MLYDFSSFISTTPNLAAWEKPEAGASKHPFWLGKESEDLKSSHHLELTIQSRLPLCTSLPEDPVMGVSIRVRLPAGFGKAADLEPYFSDAVHVVVQKIKTMLKKLNSSIECQSYCIEKFASICLLIEHLVHGLFVDAVQTVQDSFQKILDQLIGFRDFLSHCTSDFSCESVSGEMKESMESMLECILALVKPLLHHGCTFEMPREGDQALSLYQALVDSSPVNYSQGPPDLTLMDGSTASYQTLLALRLHALKKGERLMRTTLFSATRLLCDLRTHFQTDKFQRRYRTLRSSSSNSQAQMEALQLVLEIQSLVLPTYGFDGNAKGVKLMREECGYYAAVEKDDVMFKLRSDIHYLVESGRTDITHSSSASLEKFKVMPLVTAVIPTHRGRLHLLRDAVLSALTQTYGNVDVVIAVQNIPGREDARYLDTVRQMFQRLMQVTVVPAFQTGGEPPSRFQDWRRQSRAAYVRNAGIRNAKGDFVAFLDDDDVWLRWKLSEQISAMCQAKSDISATEAYGGHLHLLRPWNPLARNKGEAPPDGKEGMPLFNREMNRDVLDLLVPDYSPEDSYVTGDILKQHNVIVTSTVVMSGALLKRLGLMSEKATNEDHDFWCRAVDLAGPILAVPDALSVYDCMHGLCEPPERDQL